MVSHNSIRREEEVQVGRTEKSMRHVMVGHDATSNKDRVPRAAAVMTIDLNQFGQMSGKGTG